MKRLGLALTALLVSVTMSYAQSSNAELRKEPFAVSFEQLSKFLELAPHQINEVADINAYFIEKQNESLRSSASLQDKKMHQAVYGNLKLMRQTLTSDQYRKYVALINVTNNNQRVLGTFALPDIFLADNTQK